MNTNKARAPADSGNMAGGRHWPPRDPPMFWITALTMAAIMVYIYLALRIAADGNSGRSRDYLVLKGMSGIKIVDLPHQKVTSVKVPSAPRHSGTPPSAEDDLQVVGVVVSAAQTPKQSSAVTGPASR